MITAYYNLVDMNGQDYQEEVQFDNIEEAEIWWAGVVDTFNEKGQFYSECEMEEVDKIGLSYHDWAMQMPKSK